MGELLPNIVLSTHEYEPIFPALYLQNYVYSVKTLADPMVNAYCCSLLHIVKDLLLISSPKNHLALLLEHILPAGMVFSLAWDSVFSFVLIKILRTYKWNFPALPCVIPNSTC